MDLRNDLFTVDVETYYIIARNGNYTKGKLSSGASLQVVRGVYVSSSYEEYKSKCDEFGISYDIPEREL